LLAIQGEDAREWPAVSEGNRLRSLEAVVSCLAAPAPVERMAEAIGDATRSAIGADLVVVALVDDDRELRALHATGVPPGALRQVVNAPPDDGLVVQPIALGQRTLGVIVLGRGAAPRFSEGDRGFVHVVAGLFALALDRRRLAGHRGLVPRPVQVGGLAIDLERQEVSIDGRSVRLTPSELRLLLLLAEQPGRPRTRREILRHLSGADHEGRERACDVHIANLRRKVERDPSRPERLITLRGLGYALTVDARQLGARRA
jgi:DNA-binding winged helix-turn-helix (wHTH) protein